MQLEPWRKGKRPVQAFCDDICFLFLATVILQVRGRRFAPRKLSEIGLEPHRRTTFRGGVVLQAIE